MTPERSEDRRFPSRRAFVGMGMGAFVVAALPLGARGRRRLVRRRIPVMGTVAEVAVVHRDPAWARAAAGAALEEMRRVDRDMSRHDPASEVGRANREALRRPVPVSPGTARVLEAGLAWARRTGGRFDPALAGAVALWSPEERSAPPPEGRIRRWAGRELWRRVEVDRTPAGPRLRFHDPDAGVDLGGIAKGWGVDRAVAALREWGIRDGLVSAGGDLYALGRSEDDDPWEVGVRDPLDPRRIAGRLRVEDRAVATSGDYESYFEHEGRRYHHLLDPRTGAPRRGAVRSLTVEAGDCLTADAAATAVFGASRAEAERLLEEAAPDASIVHSA
jgi:thiamine biosynthesis lipoprotein